MPRWFALCHGAVDFPACHLCRRFLLNNTNGEVTPQQAIVQPELMGRHCNRFMEMPPSLGINPTRTKAKTHG